LPPVLAAGSHLSALPHKLLHTVVDVRLRPWNTLAGHTWICLVTDGDRGVMTARCARCAVGFCLFR